MDQDTEALWRQRVLLALAGSAGSAEPSGGPGPAEGAASTAAVIEEVAIRFADRFDPTDRAYRGDRPLWHLAVEVALTQLRADGSLRPDPIGSGLGPLVLSGAGRRRAARAAAALAAQRPVPPATADDPAAPSPAGDASDFPGERPPLLTAGVIAPPLRSAQTRERVGFPTGADVPGPVMAELNLHFRGGGDAALARLGDLWGRAVAGSGGADRRPQALGDEYATGLLSLEEMKRIVSADTAVPMRSGRCLRRIWPDFEIREQIDHSCVTVKADAARRTFNAHGERIVWAVVDSGVDGDHPHFATHRTLSHERVADLHRCFPLSGGDPAAALVDESGHGTHVAGIIAGAIDGWLAADPQRRVLATESRFNIEDPLQPLRLPRNVDDPSMLSGVAPRAKLVSLKVLPGGGSRARVARVIEALEYVREVNGDCVDSMRIHGVNLSLGYEFDPEWFACGQSPLCREVDKLVRSGVVVVVAAGNSGYGSLAITQDAPTRFGLGMTINDPGNAELAITVGSTHRDAPHSYGVSWFSSKGPTGDGRPKPDLVAPGERITSCAAGRALTSVVGPEGLGPAEQAVYVEDTGTSMAAPHVSGAIAALLSVRREFIGDPEAVKDIIVGSAISLRRAPEFQGAGLLDLMRALQSI